MTVLEVRGKEGQGVHYEIYPSQLLGAFGGSFVQALGFPDVNGADTEDLRAGPRGGDVFGHGFCFFNVAADDAGVCAEVDEGADLGAADGAGAAGAEDDFVGCEGG